jgi:hypothetical protein
LWDGSNENFKRKKRKEGEENGTYYSLALAIQISHGLTNYFILLGLMQNHKLISVSSLLCRQMIIDFW